MKRNVILLVNGDADTCAATLAAADSMKLDVRFAEIRRDLSEINEVALDDVAVIVLDYDPDVHGREISDTLNQWSPPRPLVFISSNEHFCHPMLLAGRKAAHLMKPVTSGQIAHAIDMVAPDSNCSERKCDRWGHPFNARSGLPVPNPEKVARESV